MVDALSGLYLGDLNEPGGHIEIDVLLRKMVFCWFSASRSNLKELLLFQIDTKQILSSGWQRRSKSACEEDQMSKHLTLSTQGVKVPVISMSLLVFFSPP